ncbi:hypothetical protein PN441_05000 [Spirulina major CS-329]|nr:hypothetical protein [Spirulina major]MDB9502421.1 hypothetical protein [Spirulina major CS-329]
MTSTLQAPPTSIRPLTAAELAFYHENGYLKCQKRTPVIAEGLTVR